MAKEGIDRFGSEKKLLTMAMLCVAEKHARKGLATKLAKVSDIL